MGLEMPPELKIRMMAPGGYPSLILGCTIYVRLIIVDMTIAHNNAKSPIYFVYVLTINPRRFVDDSSPHSEDVAQFTFAN